METDSFPLLPVPRGPDGHSTAGGGWVLPLTFAAHVCSCLEWLLLTYWPSARPWRTGLPMNTVCEIVDQMSFGADVDALRNIWTGCDILLC